jgi:hypothetical protein
MANGPTLLAVDGRFGFKVSANGGFLRQELRARRSKLNFCIR